MSEQHLVLLDTSFKSSFCYFDSLDQLPEMQRKWNLMIENISLEFPGFENDYEVIDIPLSMLEVIGEGGWFKQLLSVHGELHNNCFPLASDMLLPKEMYINLQREAIEQLDNQFIKTFNNLLEFYMHYLSPELMVEKINEFIQKKSFHPVVQFMSEQLVVWRNDIAKGKINSYVYWQLCRDLAWDALVKRENWGNDKDDVGFIDMKSGDMEFVSWQKKEIIKRLIIHYYKHAQENDYLAGAVLLAWYATLLKNNKMEKTYKTREFLDPYFIEYACSGFYNIEAGKRRKVIVLTCDAKGTEKKVVNYIKAKKSINKELEDAKETSLIQGFEPGYIVIMDSVTNSVRKRLDISKLI